MSKSNDVLTDHELFMHAMQDVVPLKKSKSLTPSTPTILKRKSVIPNVQLENENEIALSDHCAEDILPEQFIIYTKNGLHPRYLRQLKQGKILIQAELDLHGNTIDQAREKLVKFINHAVNRHYRCLRIIHGKGYRAVSKIPILKTKTYTWLKQLPTVLAFCSCQPKDGGTGAVYVLLKKVE